MKKEKLEDMFMVASSTLLIGILGYMQTEQFDLHLEKYSGFSKNQLYSYNSQVDALYKSKLTLNSSNFNKQPYSLL